MYHSKLNSKLASSRVHNSRENVAGPLVSSTLLLCVTRKNSEDYHSYPTLHPSVTCFLLGSVTNWRRSHGCESMLLLVFSVVMALEPRALCIIGKHSITEPQTQLLP